MNEPAPNTLARYGLSLAEWRDMYEAQGGKCGVCRKKKKLVIDHEHVANWKKMEPKVRKLFVRGLACNFCNHWVIGYRVTAKLHRQAARYLDAYEKRK